MSDYHPPLYQEHVRPAAASAVCAGCEGPALQLPRCPCWPQTPILGARCTQQHALCLTGRWQVTHIQACKGLGLRKSGRMVWVAGRVCAVEPARRGGGLRPHVAAAAGHAGGPAAAPGAPHGHAPGAPPQLPVIGISMLVGNVRAPGTGGLGIRLNSLGVLPETCPVSGGCVRYVFSTRALRAPQTQMSLQKLF